MTTTTRKTPAKRTKTVDAAKSTDNVFSKEYLVSIDDTGLIPDAIIDRQIDDVKQAARQQGHETTGAVKFDSKSDVGPRMVSLKYSVTIK